MIEHALWPVILSQVSYQKKIEHYSHGTVRRYKLSLIVCCRSWSTEFFWNREFRYSLRSLGSRPENGIGIRFKFAIIRIWQTEHDKWHYKICRLERHFHRIIHFTGTLPIKSNPFSGIGLDRGHSHKSQLDVEKYGTILRSNTFDSIGELR